MATSVTAALDTTTEDRVATHQNQVNKSQRTESLALSHNLLAAAELLEFH